MRCHQLIYQQPPHHATEETESQPTLGYRSTTNYHAAMTGRDPYYVRKGWVDDDRHVRVVQSSLKIMQSMDDVYDSDTTTADDVVTDMYTYPAPSEDASDNPYTEGYFYLGGLVDLVDSMPPSPVQGTRSSPLTAGDSPDEGDLGSLATVTASKLNIHFQPPSLSAQSTQPVDQVSKMYTQDLPYGGPQTIWQDSDAPPPSSVAPRPGMPMRPDFASTYGSFATGQPVASLPIETSHSLAPPVLLHSDFVPPAANMVSLPITGLHNASPPVPQYTTDYTPLLPSTIHPTVSWSGYPILSLPNGSRVGQPIPPDLYPIINAIRRLRIVGNTGHPERRILKKPYEGTYDTASRDGQLIRDHVAGGSGLLKTDSPLRDWYGDLSVFSAKMWEFLSVQKARVDSNAKG